MNDVSGLGPMERFRVTAQNSFRLYQFKDGRGAATIDDLIKELKTEASAMGINVDSWPYSIDGPFDKDMHDLEIEIRSKDEQWKTDGSPEPPPLKLPS